jgi:hypothetical protein
MNTMVQQWLQGRKTYLTCLAVGALLFGSWQKWWQLPPEVYAGLAALAMAFLRAGIAKVEGPKDGPEAEDEEMRNALASAKPPAQPGECGARDQEATPAPENKGGGAGAAGLMAAMLLACGALGASSLLAGCGSLDPTGVYQGNTALYQTDVALASSYEVLHGFVQWEYDNRAAMSSTPAIKAAADRVRAGAPQWFGSALALRDAWQANPTSTNQASLQQSLAVIQQATLEAIGYMTTNTAGIQTTAPQTTAPQTTAPQTTAPQTTAPQTTAPQTTAPLTTDH